MSDYIQLVVPGDPTDCCYTVKRELDFGEQTILDGASIFAGFCPRHERRVQVDLTRRESLFLAMAVVRLTANNGASIILPKRLCERAKFFLGLPEEYRMRVVLTIDTAMNWHSFPLDLNTFCCGLRGARRMQFIPKEYIE